MGKKTKVGKNRKDKFYTLAKETGYRSRAAFKLIQLNRRFAFFEKSTVCIDLCAAPGGWMQVAKQTMSVSSIVIGVDLHPIKPIPGCISLVEDITTDKCRQELTKELKTWKADIVLNDGAPNVGKNWLHDAYQQICLSLMALKLATEFLTPGGWFITKVFRSKDYDALMFVLKQLFKKVYASKPAASRNESAEMFIVCQGYKAPTKIDPKFMDPKYVFEELEIEPENKQNLLKEPKNIKKAKAVGYDSIDVRRIRTATDFLKADDEKEFLANATEIKIDDERIGKHSETTDEIKECLKDIKVLGRKDLKEVIRWWKKLKEEFYPAVVEEPVAEKAKPETEVTEEDQEEQEIDKYIDDLKLEEQQEEKRKKKRANKERAKLDQKLALKMVIKGDSGPQETQDENIFNLREIKNKKVLEKFVDGADISKKRSEKNKKAKSKMVAYDEDELHDDEAHIPTITSDAEADSDEFEEDLALGKGSDDEEGDDDNWDLRSTPKNVAGASARAGGASERNRNPLVTDLDFRDKDSKRLHKAQMWFEKDAFKTMMKTDDVDQDMDLDNLVKSYKKKGIEVIGESDKPDLSKLGKKARRRAKHQTTEDAAGSSSDDSDDENVEPSLAADGGAGPKPKKFKLNEEELALGQMMITSRKMKRDLVDGAWNRYMFNDENLPDWFVEDEKLSMRKAAPVPGELVESYRKNLTEFNTRSIKKVMEAKARKKRQNKKKMEKITKKASNIMENSEQSGQEKLRLIKKLYKKAEDKKQEVTYVVTKKGGSSGKRVQRPTGVKGRFKVVDPRLKKDMRSEQRARSKKAKARGGKGKNAFSKKTIAKPKTTKQMKQRKK